MIYLMMLKKITHHLCRLLLNQAFLKDLQRVHVTRIAVNPPDFLKFTVSLRFSSVAHK